MTHFPLFLSLNAGDRILLIGGGNIATAKLESLLPFAANLLCIASDIEPSLKEALSKAGILWQERPFNDDDLHGVRIAIAATNDHKLNEHIAKSARARGILVNAVDDSKNCDFIFPAIVRRGDVQIAISSSATSPVLARLIKQKIERVLPWNLERLTQFIRSRRELVGKTLTQLQPRRLFWEQVIDGPIAQEVLEYNDQKAEQLFLDALADFPNSTRGALYLISAGPGHPDLITVRGAQLLAQADVILYDRLVSPQLLERYARRDAEKIPVGKAKGKHSLTQPQIDALLAEKLHARQIVVRLKGGDAGIYAHAAEEIAIARDAGVAYQIVPGITAAAGCAAMAGIPLTERDGARSVRLLTLNEKDLVDTDFWNSIGAAKDETLVFYMSTAHRKALCEKLLTHGLAPTTPIVAIEQGTTPQHREYAATLATFAEYYGDYPFLSPTLFIVGEVVRWRDLHGWREPATEQRPFFTQTKEGLYATS